MARANFAHVLLIAGNHEHYDGVFDDTAGLLKRNLPSVTILDNEHVEIDGIRFFGTTLWSNFEEGSEASMNAVRRRMGEFYFVKKRRVDADGCESLAKFRPEDALEAFDASWATLTNFVAAGERPTVVVSHHAPSLQGRNPRHAGNGLDGAYGSDLDARISTLAQVPVWVHSHPIPLHHGSAEPGVDRRWVVADGAVRPHGVVVVPPGRQRGAGIS